MPNPNLQRHLKVSSFKICLENGRIVDITKKANTTLAFRHETSSQIHQTLTSEPTTPTYPTYVQILCMAPIYGCMLPKVVQRSTRDGLQESLIFWPGVGCSIIKLTRASCVLVFDTDVMCFYVYKYLKWSVSILSFDIHMNGETLKYKCMLF